MARFIVPVVPVARELMERLAKARGGLVQKQVQVKTRRGNHTRMQWVRPENDSAKGADQPGLFDEVDRPKPAVEASEKGKNAEDLFGGLPTQEKPKEAPGATPDSATVKTGLAFEYKGEQKKIKIRTSSGGNRWIEVYGAKDQPGSPEFGVSWGKTSALPTLGELKTYFKNSDEEPSPFGEKQAKPDDSPAGAEPPLWTKEFKRIHKKNPWDMKRDDYVALMVKTIAGKGLVEARGMEFAKKRYEEEHDKLAQFGVKKPADKNSDEPWDLRSQKDYILSGKLGKETARLTEGEKKKPFEDMTFEKKKATGKPATVGETVRDVLDMASGSAAQFADSRKVDDIQAFQYAAAKWAYENDKVGTNFDILDQYARSKGLRKSIFDSFREGLAKAFRTKE